MAEGTGVAVVGASGNLGTSVLDALEADPSVASVRALARRVPASGPWSKVRWEAADVVHDRLTGRFERADVVVHLAWAFQPTHDPAATWRTNVLGGTRVFEAAARAAVPKLVYASSVGAYTPRQDAQRVDETWTTHGWPGAAYTREKAYLERYLDAYEHEHPETQVVRLRPGFLFKRESAAEQRRLFAGPLLPNRLAQPELLPVLPDPGLRFQALHTTDAAEAFRIAVNQDVRGALNLAAEPVLDGDELARMFQARSVRIPSAPVRAAISAAWHSRLLPASPGLFDAALRLPLMDATRAREELGWSPRYTSREAILDFVRGLRAGEGRPTPPLQPNRTERETLEQAVSE